VCLEKYIKFKLFQFCVPYDIFEGKITGPSVGGLCAKTGQPFEILKQTGPERDSSTTFQFGAIAPSHL